MKVLICSLALCVLAASPVASGAGRPPQITCLNAVLLVMVGLGGAGCVPVAGAQGKSRQGAFVAAALGAAMCFLLQMLPLSELALGLAAVSGFGSLPRRPVPVEPQPGTC